MSKREQKNKVKGQQRIYSLTGEIIHDGEWDPKKILSTLDKGNKEIWNGKRVLDIGANTAGLSIEIARQKAEVVAIEPDPKSKNLKSVKDIVEDLIKKEELDLNIYDAGLFDAHLFGEFDIVLCLGLIYHFRYPQYLLDYLSNIEMTHLYISTQTYPSEQLMLVNRCDTSIFAEGHYSSKVILKGWHPTNPLFERMLLWAGFQDIELLTDKDMYFGRSVKGLTNSAYYKAKKNLTVDLESVKRNFA